MIDWICWSHWWGRTGACGWTWLFQMWAHSCVKKLKKLLLYDIATLISYQPGSYTCKISLCASHLSAKQPPTPSVPVIVSEVKGNSVYLKCSFGSSSNSSLGYVVAWSRLSPEGRKEELKQETTIQTSAFIELDGFNLRLGDKVWRRDCSSSTRSLLSPVQFQNKLQVLKKKKTSCCVWWDNKVRCGDYVQVTVAVP